jgi:hypothetical protein
MVIMRMMSTLDKRLTSSRLAMQASAFYQWKHAALPAIEPIDRPAPSGSRRYSSYVPSDRTDVIKEDKGVTGQSSLSMLFPSNNISADAYQKKYLSLFAENEQLRQQLQELKKATAQKNETLRKKGKPPPPSHRLISRKL